MPRRYRMEKNAEYHEHFDEIKQRSPILTPNAQNNTIGNVASMLADRQGLEALLQEYRGDIVNHKFKKANVIYSSKLGQCETVLRELKEEFKNYQQQVVNSGMSRPEVMPKHLQEKTFLAEARHDVVLEEVDKIQQKLTAFVDRETESDDRKVLRGGLWCIGKMAEHPKFKTGILCRIDGQTVSLDKDNILRIADPRSPYDTMTTVDYIAMGLEWQKETRRLNKVALAEHQRLRPFDPLPAPKKAPMPVWTKPEPVAEKLAEEKQTKPTAKTKRSA